MKPKKKEKTKEFEIKIPHKLFLLGEFFKEFFKELYTSDDPISRELKTILNIIGLGLLILLNGIFMAIGLFPGYFGYFNFLFVAIMIYNAVRSK